MKLNSARRPRTQQEDQSKAAEKTAEDDEKKMYIKIISIGEAKKVYAAACAAHFLSEGHHQEFFYIFVNFTILMNNLYPKKYSDWMELGHENLDDEMLNKLDHMKLPNPIIMNTLKWIFGY